MNPTALNKLTPAFFFQRFLENEDPARVTNFVHAGPVVTAKVDEPVFIHTFVKEIVNNHGPRLDNFEIYFSYVKCPVDTPFCQNGGFVLSVQFNGRAAMIPFQSVDGFYSCVDDNSEFHDLLFIQSKDMVTSQRDNLRARLAQYVYIRLRDMDII